MNLFDVYPLWDIEPVRGQDTTLWDKDGVEVPYQITYDDKLIFPASVAAESSNTYTLQIGDPENVSVKACGRVYPERMDDIAWENDLIGCRAYGPTLQKRGER